VVGKPIAQSPKHIPNFLPLHTLKTDNSQKTHYLTFYNCTGKQWITLNVLQGHRDGVAANIVQPQWIMVEGFRCSP
jgi:hypothetical protein